MSKSEGVGKYTKMTATVSVYFPEGKETCNYCPFIKHEEAYRRYSCRLSIANEWVITPFQTVGDNCPLIKETGEKEE